MCVVLRSAILHPIRKGGIDFDGRESENERRMNILSGWTG